LLLLLAGGYLVILGELVIYQHWDGTQLIGFSATVIGLLAVLLGLFAQGGLRVGLAILLAIISISGLIGTYEHYESRAGEGEAARPPAVQAASSTARTNMMISYRQEGGESGEAGEAGEAGEGNAAGEREGGEGGEGGEEVPPPLAPLSLAGLSLMGAAVLLAKQDGK
jgi:predicted lipid-binding transport protein (Tim44 family)